MKKIEYREGHVFENGLVLIKNLGSVRQNNGEIRLKGIFRCFCGKLFETGIGLVRRRHTNSCGCKYNFNPEKVSKKYYLKEGDSFAYGNLIFIKETEPKKELQGKINPRIISIRMGLFKCSCGKVFNTRLHAVKTGTTKTCGCARGEVLFQVSHGLVSHPLYKLWAGMKVRVANEKFKSFKNYGGRGISVFPPWREDFQMFYDYVSALPHYGEKGMTLDRINNDGNYEPGNLRWTTNHMQAINSRRRVTNKSGYVGVCFSKGKWHAYIYVHRKRHGLGSFADIQDAVDARNKFIIENNLSEYPIQKVNQCH